MNPLSTIGKMLKDSNIEGYLYMNMASVSPRKYKSRSSVIGFEWLFNKDDYIKIYCISDYSWVSRWNQSFWNWILFRLLWLDTWWINFRCFFIYFIREVNTEYLLNFQRRFVFFSDIRWRWIHFLKEVCQRIFNNILLFSNLWGIR